MLLPRFIIKTHTGALRPGNYSMLISKCTFPDRSAYPENVERRLAEYIGNKSTAKYTVLVATERNRGFGFLLDNMIWSWKGHVINTVLKYKGKHSDNMEDYLELSKIEKITYLKYFLETEGALILKLAEKFKDREELSYSYLKGEIYHIFEEIYEDYIDIAPDFRSRLRIKEMFKETSRQMKSKNHGYGEGTLAHKIKPHIEALSDLGLLAIDKKNKEEIYRPKSHNGVSPLTIFFKSLGDFRKMEETFLNDGCFPLIARALNLNLTNFSPEHKERLKQAFSYGYEVMKDKVTGMADIDALIDWCRIKLLSEEDILVNRREIEEFLTEMRKAKPSSVRYHVDGKGRVAYLILEP